MLNQLKVGLTPMTALKTQTVPVIDVKLMNYRNPMPMNKGFIFVLIVNKTPDPTEPQNTTALKCVKVAFTPQTFTPTMIRMGRDGVMNKKLYINITEVNATDGGIMNDWDIQETDVKNLSQLYKRLKKNEKGRISKMYVDDDKGKAIHVGYVVSRKEKYEDCNDTYQHETWYELLKPIKVKKIVTQYGNLHGPDFIDETKGAA